MLDVTLPAPAGREWWRAFWIAVSLGAGAVLAVIGGLAGWPVGAVTAAALLVAVTAALPAVLWPGRLARPYELWNRAARAYARRARVALLAICYYTTVLAARRASGRVLRMRRPEPGESRWVPRGTLPAEAYPAQDNAPLERRPNGSSTEFLRWMRRSGHYWMLFLLPLLLVTRGLQTGKPPPTSGIYTLY